jgi:hypothetical protein
VQITTYDLDCAVLAILCQYNVASPVNQFSVMLAVPDIDPRQILLQPCENPACRLLACLFWT